MPIVKFGDQIVKQHVTELQIT
uniref:Uncharacterized protein n=1 Tax=Arundo donax TaxID=35708 RepID=A0A0A9A119_ARUDO